MHCVCKGYAHMHKKSGLKYLQNEIVVTSKSVLIFKFDHILIFIYLFLCLYTFIMMFSRCNKRTRIYAIIYVQGLNIDVVFGEISSFF